MSWLVMRALKTAMRKTLTKVVAARNAPLTGDEISSGQLEVMTCAPSRH